MTSLTIPQQLARLDASRLRAYADNLAFYQGNQWPDARRNRRERRLVFNYAKTLIEKTTSYMMSGLNFAVDPADDTPAAREPPAAPRRPLRKSTRPTSSPSSTSRPELDAAVLGDAVFKVTWDTAERRVRVSTPDVQGLFVWWLGDDTSRIWRVASRYRLSPEEVEMLYAAPTKSRAKQCEVVEVWTDQDFELWVDNVRIDQKPNPYGFIPFVVYPNLREPKQFWGVSDVPAIKESVRELNRALSQLSMILELSGNPIAVLENVGESQDIAVQPGAVWELPERARAYLLDLLQGGGVKLHVDYVDLIYRTLHDLGESPRTAFGENRQGLSGVALNVEMDPLLKKVQRKRLIRSSAYGKRCEMVLRLLERFTGESYAPYRARIIWGSVLPEDRSRLVEDEVRLVQAGVHSRRTAANELGVEDPEEEYRRCQEEHIE